MCSRACSNRCRRSERRDRGVAVLHVSLRLVTRDVHECRLELPSPLRDIACAAHARVARCGVASAGLRFIDAVTITIERRPAASCNMRCSSGRIDARKQLSTLLARPGAHGTGPRRCAGADRFVPARCVRAPPLRSITGWHPAGAGGGRGGCGERNWQWRQDARGQRRVNAASASSHASLFAGRCGCADIRRGQGVVTPARRYRRCAAGNLFPRVATDGHQRPLRVFTDRRGFAGGAVVSCGTVENVGCLVGRGGTQKGGWDQASHPTRACGQRYARPLEWLTHQKVARPARTSSGLAGSDAALAVSPSRESGGGRPARREGGGRGPWVVMKWDVALADGAVYRIFRDRTTDGGLSTRWWIDGAGQVGGCAGGQVERARLAGGQSRRVSGSAGWFRCLRKHARRSSTRSSAHVMCVRMRPTERRGC